MASTENNEGLTVSEEFFKRRKRAYIQWKRKMSESTLIRPIIERLEKNKKDQNNDSDLGPTDHDLMPR